MMSRIIQNAQICYYCIKDSGLMDDTTMLIYKYQLVKLYKMGSLSGRLLGWQLPLLVKFGFPLDFDRNSVTTSQNN